MSDASNSPTGPAEHAYVERLEKRELLAATFQTFALPTGSHPDKVVTGLDGSVYVFEHGANAIARLRPHAKAFAQIPVSAQFDPVHFGMAVSNKGDVYFSVHDGIGAYSPKFNTVRVIPLSYTPNDFVAASDGNLWFTSPDNSTYGRLTLTTSGRGGQLGASSQVQTWVVPSFTATGAATTEAAIARGPKGDIWFTENGPNLLAQVIPAKTGAPTIHEYTIPTTGSNPLGIFAGPDGNMYFAETATNKIGKINEKSKVVTEFNIPRAGGNPFWISAGPDKALWFTERGADRLGRITTGGVITDTDIVPGGTGAGLTSDVKGPGKTLFFTERDHDAVGERTF